MLCCAAGTWFKARAIEHYGTPIDAVMLAALREEWDGIKDHLIDEIDVSYGVFENRVFKVDRFDAWLTQNQIPWPRHESGRLDLSDETFREMAGPSDRLTVARTARQLGRLAAQ